MLRHSFILVLIFASGSLLAQVRITGTAMHAGKPVDGATIEVRQGGKVQSVVSANKRGQYAIDFPFGKDYVIVFKREGMIPASIAVNTKVNTAQKTGLTVDVPLNMTLFYYFDGMNTAAYQKPIGEIKEQGTGENTFGFVPDKENLVAIKAVNAESERRKSLGERPVNMPPMMMTATRQTAHPTAPTETAADLNKLAEKRKTERNVARFESVEQSQLEQANMKRTLHQASNNAALKKTEQESHLAEQKSQMSQHAQEMQRQREYVTDAKASKQTDLVASVEYVAENAVYGRGAVGHSPIPLRKTAVEGWFSETERLMVNEQGEQCRYEKVSYDIFLFNAVYYYRNDDEITREEYATVARLFK